MCVQKSLRDLGVESQRVGSSGELLGCPGRRVSHTVDGVDRCVVNLPREDQVVTTGLVTRVLSDGKWVVECGRVWWYAYTGV